MFVGEQGCLGVKGVFGGVKGCRGHNRLFGVKMSSKIKNRVASCRALYVHNKILLYVKFLLYIVYFVYFILPYEIIEFEIFIYVYRSCEPVCR